VTRGLRDEHHPEDVYNRSILRDRWSKYLAPDISDYCLLAEIEAGEGETWRWLRDVPTDIIARYDSWDNRAVGRPPFRLQIGSGADPQMGYLHIDAAPDALGVDIVQDPLKQLPFREGSVVEILAEHTIELISPRDLPQVLAEFHRVLAKGGKVQIRTPSLQNIVADYLHAASGALSSGRPAALLKLDENNPVIQAKTGSLSNEHFPTDLREVCMCGESLAALCRAIGFSESHLNAVAEESWVVALR
jgi:hypothetical protein